LGRRLTRWGAVGAALVLMAAAVPAYGYWPALSRGYVSISLLMPIGDPYTEFSG